MSFLCNVRWAVLDITSHCSVDYYFCVLLGELEFQTQVQITLKILMNPVLPSLATVIMPSGMLRPVGSKPALPCR